MLMMKKEYFQAIRQGEKTTTLRFWRRRQVRPGTVHNIRGLGNVRIVDIKPTELADLTEAHAHADGFDSLAHLRDALDSIYPPAERDGRTLYLVTFTFPA